MCYLTRLGIVSLQVPYSFVSYTSVKLAEPHVNWRLLGGRLVWKPRGRALGHGFGRQSLGCLHLPVLVQSPLHPILMLQAPLRKPLGCQKGWRTVGGLGVD